MGCRTPHQDEEEDMKEEDVTHLVAKMIADVETGKDLERRIAEEEL